MLKQSVFICLMGVRIYSICPLTCTSDIKVKHCLSRCLHFTRQSLPACKTVQTNWFNYQYNVLAVHETSISWNLVILLVHLIPYSAVLEVLIVLPCIFIASFILIMLPSLLCPSVCSLMETELTSLCQSVLEDFNLVLFYLPPPTHGGAHHSPSEEEEEQHADSSCPVLPDTLVFKMVVTCLMVVHSLKRGG